MDYSKRRGYKLTTVIETIGLSKSYQGFRAVQDISLKIKMGDIYGFIGLNGAGKTTVIRLLLGLIRPTQGASYIYGEKVILNNHHIWKKVGYIVETPHFYPELTVQENLEIYKRLSQISDPNAVLKVMDQLNISQYAHIKAQNLSLGNTQRLGIAKALLPKPDILILDEPVNGLDPAGMIEIRELLQRLAVNEGITILISSHLLSEVTKIATKIGIIHEGKLIREIQTKELNLVLNQRLLIDTRDNQAAKTTLLAAGYSPVINENGLLEIHDQNAIMHPDELSHFLVFEKLPATQLTVEKEDLESYFLKIIQKRGE